MDCPLMGHAHTMVKPWVWEIAGYEEELGIGNRKAYGFIADEIVGAVGRKKRNDGREGVGWVMWGERSAT